MTEQKMSPFIVIIRPQFMGFCGDACRAAALNHLLFRIAWKCKDQSKGTIQNGEVLWYAKTEQITEEMADAWGVCKVRKEVNMLIDMKLIGRKANPKWGVDRTKHFCFGKNECAVLLGLCEKQNVCLVHLDLPAEVKHLIYTAAPNDRSIKCCCPEGEASDKSIICPPQNEQGHLINLSDASDKSIGTIPKNTTKILSPKEESVVIGENETIAGPGAAAPIPPVEENALVLQTPTAPRRGKQSAVVEKPAKEEAPQRRTRTPKQAPPPPPVFTEGGRLIFVSWGKIFTVVPDAGPKTIEAANSLYDKIIPWCYRLNNKRCKDLLDDIRKWCFATNPTWYRDKGVSLCDIARDFEKWQSHMEQKLEEMAAEEKRKAAQESQTQKPRTVSGMRSLALQN